MGNIVQCSSVKIDQHSQLIIQQQTDANVDTSNQQLQDQLIKKIKKFQMLTKMDTNSLGFQKLQHTYQELHKIDTMLDNDSIEDNKDNILIESLQQKYMNEQTPTKIKDYISFKKYSPKIHYKFIKMIHASNSSKIYEVIHNNTNIHKIIKAIKPIYSSSNKFINLTSVLNQLDHPNIIRFYQVFQYKNNQYFVMELMEGGSMKDIPNYRRLIKSNSTDCAIDNYFQEIKIIAKQILYALSYLHENNIAHLNIHTKNILLSYQFGTNKFKSKKQVLAKLVGFGSSSINLTNNLTLMNNILYLNKCSVNQLQPPEILFQKSICLKTDIWMLGIALFESITKIKISKSFIKQPNSDKNKLTTYLQSIWRKLQKQLNFSQSHFIDLIQKMVQNNPKQRPSALQCLQHPWFVSLDLDQLDTNLKQNNNRVLRSTLVEKKSNNLITYIENLIVYKNITQTEMLAAAEIFSTLDKDKNGTVQIEQLIDYFHQQCNQKLSTKIFSYSMELLNSLDRDGSGTIDYHQFSKALANKRKHITKNAIQQIFDHIDIDGDGKIVIQELKNSLKNCDLNELEYYLNKIDKNFDSTINKGQFITYCLQKFQEKWEKDGEKKSR